MIFFLFNIQQQKVISEIIRSCLVGYEEFLRVYFFSTNFLTLSKFLLSFLISKKKKMKKVDVVIFLMIFLFSTTLGISYNSFTQTGTNTQWSQSGVDFTVSLGNGATSAELDLSFTVPSSLATSFTTTFSFKIKSSGGNMNIVVKKFFL